MKLGRNVKNKEQATKLLYQRYPKHSKPSKNPKRKVNGNSLVRAVKISTGFHGREPVESFDIKEPYHYSENVAQLGVLVELGILIGEDKLLPIQFDYQNGDDDNLVRVCANDEDNIEFIGGDQDIDISEITAKGAEVEEVESKKQLIFIGEVLTIAYFADKHHLVGPKNQALGTEYEHEFGEEGGELPVLVFDNRNKKMMLVGGSYSITDEGIKN